MVVALVVAAFSEVEDDASGTDGWPPLSTIASPIPLLVPLLPPETAAASAVGGTAPFSFIKAEAGVSTEAVFFVIHAHVPTAPIVKPILPLAAIHGLDVLRVEDQEEGEQQSAPP